MRRGLLFALAGSLGCAACTSILGDYAQSLDAGPDGDAVAPGVDASMDAGRHDATTVDARNADAKKGDAKGPVDAPADTKVVADATSVADVLDAGTIIDATHPNEAASETGPCGAAEEPCCTTGTQCSVGLACNSFGTCGADAGDIGKPCTAGSTCSSDLCLPSTDVCTHACGDAGSCPATWGCGAVLGANACTCTKSNGGVEICDGKDNDCNGVVDDPGAANAYCTRADGGAFGFTCVNGACACAGTMCSGLCTDLQTNENSCGACGHYCQNGGGGCVNGQCQPYVYVTTSGTPTAVASISGEVFFAVAPTNDTKPTGTIQYCSVGPEPCSMPENCALSFDDVQGLSLWQAPLGGTSFLAIAANGAQIQTAPLSTTGNGCSAGNTEVAFGVGAEGVYGSPATDGTTIYWAAALYGTGGAQVESIPLSASGSTTPTTVYTAATGETVGGVAVGGGSLFFSVAGVTGPNVGDILTCPTSNCTSPTVFASGFVSPGALFYDSSASPPFLSWVDEGSNANSNDGGIYGCKATGPCGAKANTVAIAAQQINPIALAVDQRNVFWLSGTSVWTCPKNAPCATPLALTTGQAGLNSLAVDPGGSGGSAWWTNASAGTVTRVAKPY